MGHDEQQPKARASRRRRWSSLAWLTLGLALAAWLVFRVSAPAIATALRAAGWTALAAISAFHLIATLLMGLAWWSIARSNKRWVFVWARLVRDAGSEVLPLSQIGGFVLGARVLVVCGVGDTVAAAATVVDATLEFLAQITYAALGLALLMWLMPGSALAGPAAIGLALAIVAVLAFIAVQRRGSDSLARVTAPIARRWVNAAFTRTTAVQAEIRRVYRSAPSLVLSFTLHLAAWLFTGAEAWLSLRFMGVSLNPIAVLTLESLLYATRAAAFMVPNGIGVQEGAYIVLGASFGLAPDVALALSLLKRGRDLVLGVTALVVWQVIEARRQRLGVSTR
jgi:putative membrane protein